MYENHVAHRYVTVCHHLFAQIVSSDVTYIRGCTSENIMSFLISVREAGMFPESFHPTEIGRSKDFRRKVKCYGLPLDKPLRGGNNRPRSTRIG